MKKFATLILISALSCGISAAQEKETAAEVSVSGLTFSYDKPWKKQEPASSMRAAQLLYDNEDELADVEAIFFHFGPQSGSIEANLQRWAGQFEGKPESKTEEKDHNGTKVTYFTASGTFLDGGMRGPKTPKENWVMLAAIVPGTEGPVFIKLVGPKAAVEGVKADFEKLAASPFPKKDEAKSE